MKIFIRLDIGNKRWCPPTRNVQHSALLGRVLISNHNQYLDCCLIELYGFMMVGDISLILSFPLALDSNNKLRS